MFSYYFQCLKNTLSLSFTDKILTISLSLTLLSMISGCQLLPVDNSASQSETNSINYGQYYLLLTELNDKQMTNEVHQHQLVSPLESISSIQSETHIVSNTLASQRQLKSVLLFALPHSPIHNPYTAKSKLNQLSLSNLSNINLTAADFSFFQMLKVQLNQQILLLNELSFEKKAHQITQQSYQHQQQQFQALQQQIIQLKKIERNINEHGQ